MSAVSSSSFTVPLRVDGPVISMLSGSLTVGVVVVVVVVVVVGGVEPVVCPARA